MKLAPHSSEQKSQLLFLGSAGATPHSHKCPSDHRDLHTPHPPQRPSYYPSCFFLLSDIHIIWDCYIYHHSPSVHLNVWLARHHLIISVYLEISEDPSRVILHHYWRRVLSFRSKCGTICQLLVCDAPYTLYLLDQGCPWGLQPNWIFCPTRNKMAFIKASRKELSTC